MTGPDVLGDEAVEVVKPVLVATVPLPGAVIDGSVLETEGSDDADGEDDETDTGLVDVAVADDTPIVDDSSELSDAAEDDD